MRDEPYGNNLRDIADFLIRRRELDLALRLLGRFPRIRPALFPDRSLVRKGRPGRD